MNVLITGATGDIGKAITKIFKDNNYSVYTPSRDELDLSVDPILNRTDFDIVINTDFDNNVLTANRPDNKGAISKYKYDNVDVLRSELTEYYNIHNQLKDIIIYTDEKSLS